MNSSNTLVKLYARLVRKYERENEREKRIGLSGRMSKKEDPRDPTKR